MFARPCRAGRCSGGPRGEGQAGLGRSARRPSCADHSASGNVGRFVVRRRERRVRTRAYHRRGVISEMTTQDSEMKAATAAAKAREVIANRITKLVPATENEELASVVVHLAEAYANLAVEPPRSRAG